MGDAAIAGDDVIANDAATTKTNTTNITMRFKHYLLQP
jgi:hypothetical protein